MSQMDLISPIDGKVYISRQSASVAEASAIFAKARAAQVGWAKTPLAERIAATQAFIAALLTMKDEMVTELAWQMGRPTRYGGEFGGVIERTDYMSSIAAEALAPLMVEDSAAFKRAIKRVPLGVVLVIAPWNYPYLTAVNTIVPALIAGNVVVLKHALQTLLVGERFEKAAQISGLPEGIFTNIVMDHPTSEALIGAGAADFINFTGSVGGGRAIERAAAGTFTGIGLELGGKDPALVCEDADIERAVETLIDGAMYNAGQCCCGIERIYVARPLYQRFVDMAVAETEKLVLGNPLDASSTLGPMANKRFADVVRAQTAAAIAEGATAHIQKGKYGADDGHSAYLAPQILTNVSHKMAVMQEESFGPIVGIMPVDSDQEAISLMNDSQFGLTASIWTQDRARAEHIGDQIETGTIFMNRCDYLDPALCWTGCKDTGRGGALSPIGYHNLSRPKSYHLRA